MAKLVSTNNKKSPIDSLKLKRQQYLIRALLMVAIMTGLGVTWHKVFQDKFIPKRWGVIDKKMVYRSGQLDQMLVESQLKKYNIQVIIDMTGRVDNDQDQRAEEKAAIKLKINHQRFPLGGDGTGDINHYADALTKLHEAILAKKPVLIHCHAGAQRTGGMVFFYRILMQHRDPKEVCQENMAYGFRPHKKDKKLIDYVNKHMAELASILLKRKVITSLPNPMPVVIP